ncbi:MAG: PAS domain S-box protein, partial [Chloroflexi bacterium]|nr:PAS domain S-box protein [Chloroflexota bacterium]
MASETNSSGQNCTTPLEATSDTPSSLAAILTGYLTRRGWVEDDLAAHLGVELSTLRRLLLEPAPTSSDRVAALASAYGVSTSRLLAILWLEQVLPQPAIDDERPRQGVELVATEAANAEERAHTTSRLIIRGTERYFELSPAQRERVRRALARIAAGIQATPYLIAEVEVAHDAGPEVGSVRGRPTSRPDSGRAVGKAGATDAAPGSGAAESASHTELIQVLMGTAGFRVGITPTPLARLSSSSDSVDAVFRELFDEAPIAYHELDLDGRIIRVNRTELAWLGYTQTEMVGHYVWEFIREAEESRRGFFAKVAERESGHAYERTYRRKDGSWVCGLVENRLIRDSDGHVIGSRSAILDITNRKRSEDALRLSEQRLRLAVEGAPVSLFTQDIDLRYTWVYNVAGMADGDLLGKADAELWPADEAGPLIALKREVLERGHAVRRVVHLTFENALRQLEIRAEPLRSTDGPVVGLVGAAVDVTGHRQTETAWRASAERYRRLLEAAPDATVLVAASGRILLLNRQSEHLFGYDQDELVGQPVELLLPEQLRGVHFEHRTQYAASPKRRPMGAGLELSARRKDGSEVPVEISLSPLEFDDERVVIASIRDCTERRRTEAALRQQAAELRSQAELLELVHDAVIVREPTTSAIVFWNRAAERLYGWARAEAQRQITHSLLRTEFPVSLEAVDAVLARDGVWEGELKHVTKDGRWLLVASRQALQRDEHGQPTAILEINRDVTEQRHAEQALVTSEQRYRIVSELTSDFAYAARLLPDGSRIPEWITEAVTSVTGYSPAEIVERRSILSLAHPDDQPRVAALNTRVLAGMSATEELRLVTKAGQLRWVRLYNQPEVDEVT